MTRYRQVRNRVPLSAVFEVFGIRSGAQVASDLKFVAGRFPGGFQLGLSSIDFIRPDLSLPAYAGRVPEDGMAPIYHLFDRVGGGRRYCQRVTRKWRRDFRNRTLTYDDHDGIDFVCPVGTRLCAAAPGTVVMVRDRWLRGGITVAVDHGNGLVTQYTHCWRPLVPVGRTVRRGEPVALSGASGLDMTLFFPWVPPHIHFMVWWNGRPQDPYLADGEQERPGVWLSRNNPQPAEGGSGEEIPASSDVDPKAVDEIQAACRDGKIQRELAAAAGDYPVLAAILEDALHHDDWAWPPGFRDRTVRPPLPAPTVKLNLPLPADTYRGAFFADLRKS
jgi:hypothetical protein